MSKLNLRPLSDEEYDAARARRHGIPLSQCPTCKSMPEEIPESDGLKERPPSQYKLYGEMHDCDCQTQIRLRRHYLAANIGDQYQNLDWAEYNSDLNAKKMVADYLSNWEGYRDHGMGLTFSSKSVGTGKTFAATYMARELIKLGQKVYFVQFTEMIATFERGDEGRALEDKMKSVTYLVLDDVLRPSSERMRDLYAMKLEAMIRYRTNYNLPSIVTTNLESDELEEHYPRTFSLLSLKQIEIPMQGNDARSRMAIETQELVANGEQRPLL